MVSISQMDDVVQVLQAKLEMAREISRAEEDEVEHLLRRALSVREGMEEAAAAGQRLLAEAQEKFPRCAALAE